MSAWNPVDWICLTTVKWWIFSSLLKMPLKCCILTRLCFSAQRCTATFMSSSLIFSHCHFLFHFFLFLQFNFYFLYFLYVLVPCSKKTHLNYQQYFSHQLSEKADSNLKLALHTSEGDKRGAVLFADTITLLFEGIARVVEIHQPLVETYYGEWKEVYYYWCGRLTMVS